MCASRSRRCLNKLTYFITEKLIKCLKRCVLSAFCHLVSRTDCENIVCIELQFTSNVPSYMLTPQLSSSDLPGGRGAKRGPGREHCHHNLIYESHSGETKRHSKEIKWAKESCRLRPRMGLFLVEAGMRKLLSLFCRLHFFFLLFGTLLICSPTAPG